MMADINVVLEFESPTSINHPHILPLNIKKQGRGDGSTGKQRLHRSSIANGNNRWVVIRDSSDTVHTKYSSQLHPFIQTVLLIRRCYQGLSDLRRQVVQLAEQKARSKASHAITKLRLAHAHMVLGVYHQRNKSVASYDDFALHRMQEAQTEMDRIVRGIVVTTEKYQERRWAVEARETAAYYEAIRAIVEGNFGIARGHLMRSARVESRLEGSLARNILKVKPETWLDQVLEHLIYAIGNEAE